MIVFMRFQIGVKILLGICNLCYIIVINFCLYFEIFQEIEFKYEKLINLVNKSLQQYNFRLL